MQSGLSSSSAKNLTIKRKFVRGSSNRLGGGAIRLWLIAAALSLNLFVPSSPAQIITLHDQNSSASVNLSSGAGNSGGMTNWVVDGQNELAQQWFWYRVGSSGPEHPISAIGSPLISTPNARTLYTTYNNGSYGVTINYLLTGSSPGSGKSDISESISITNGTASPLQFHFYQYSDFDLGGAGGDTVQLGRNLRGLFNEADQTDGSVLLTETVVTPGANHGEAAFYNATLVKLSDANTDTLNDNAGPVGPGNVTWALQWDFTIAPGSSVGISKDKYLQVPIPEPSVLGLAAIGLLTWTLRRRVR